MKDKLTKKRIRVDYQLIIRVLGLDLDFTEYCFKKNSSISQRRLAYAFLNGRKIKIDEVWQSCLEHGFTCFEDYQAENIRLAKYNFWDED